MNWRDEMTKLTYIQKENRYQERLIKKLKKFYELTLDNLHEASHGHTPNWIRVIELSNEIEDKFNLDLY